MMLNINQFIKIGKCKETVFTEINISKDGKEIISLRDGNTVLKKCKCSLKTFFIRGVSKKSIMQTITQMMEWEALFLEEIQTGINEEWNKTKINRMTTRIRKIMMKIKNNKINKINKNRIDL